MPPYRPELITAFVDILPGVLGNSKVALFLEVHLPSISLSPFVCTISPWNCGRETQSGALTAND